MLRSVPDPEDTIVAVSSASGSGFRAIVRLSGPQTRSLVQRCFRPGADLQPFSRTPGQLRLTGCLAPVPAQLYFWASPRSYTGQDLAEFHLPGSQPLVDALMADLLAAGARSAEPGEFTLRAFLAGKKDLPQAEAVLTLIHASDEADLKPALARLAGGVSRPLEELRHDLLNLLADLEAGLDFVDEDIEFVSVSDLLTRSTAALAQLTNLRRQLEQRTVSDRPIRVALFGEPNAGKSSLFNALAGSERALVSPIAGTTRDYLSARIQLGSYTVELLDTPGLELATGSITEQAQQLGREQARDADIVLWCVPIDENLSSSPSPTTQGSVIIVRTKDDANTGTSIPAQTTTCVTSIHHPNGLSSLRVCLKEAMDSLSRTGTAAPSARATAHVDAAMAALRRVHEHARNSDPQELTALALREALDEIGCLVGAVFTNDLLDRIFSRFCIGK